MARVHADQQVLADSGRWSHLDDRARVRWAVSAVADVFASHAPFLRAVVLSSSVHPEVARRGRAYAEELTEAFAGVVLSAGPVLRLQDPPAAVRAAFSTVFASLVMHTAYGPTFAWARLDEQSFRGHLAEMVANHLLGWAPARRR